MLSALIAAQLALLADKALVLICGRLSAAAFWRCHQPMRAYSQLSGRAARVC